MKQVYMKTTITLTIISIVLLYSFTNPQSNNTLSGQWKLISIENIVTKEKELRPKRIYDSPTIMVFTFDDNGITGNIQGFTTVNNVSGNYTLDENNKISVTKFGGTKIGEHGWGKNFWSIINEAYSYTFHVDSLFIHSKYDSTKLCFIPLEK